MLIDCFHGEYRWLSNFWPAPVQMYGKWYATVEHAYQAAKTLDEAERFKIRTALTPGVAKRLGRTVTIRPDWDSFKLVAMEELLRRKFAHPNLREWLIATEDAELVEGNTWGDTFWGVCRGEGRNNLGVLLMKIRSELVADTAE